MIAAWLIACPCVCVTPPRREVVIITLQSVSVYDLLIAEQAEPDEAEDGWNYYGPPIEPEFYYPVDDEPIDSDD